MGIFGKKSARKKAISSKKAAEKEIADIADLAKEESDLRKKLGKVLQKKERKQTEARIRNARRLAEAQYAKEDLQEALNGGGRRKRRTRRKRRRRRRRRTRRRKRRTRRKRRRRRRRTRRRR